MKNALHCIVTIIVCLTVLMGCAREDAQVGATEEYCYVVCLKEDGFIAEIEHVGYVYVKYANSDSEIELLDTVVMEFSESDLTPAKGKFLTFDGREQSYSYTLENAKKIRFPDPSNGEPTFG